MTPDLSYTATTERERESSARIINGMEKKNVYLAGLAVPKMSGNGTFTP